ncbi:hypothetical protein RchiOBHm_Chr5g0081081 [Rosa chinensis]|uniref:Uncharacterized protein n=1 Tax=Rosa chinensis TaxID=74649 RepID=A0A2P6QMZ4_ROSCH|nr:hypothetical protein RchiOBHm_Chr5g0081081 [Rosa chinensis]
MPMRFCRSTSQFRRLTQMMGWFANPQSEHDSYHFIFGTMVCLLLESKCKGLAVVITDWNTRRSKGYGFVAGFCAGTWVQP